MKEHTRVFGFDDAPFSFGDKSVLVVGVFMRLPNYIEAVLSTKIEVDGTDATDKLVECIVSSNYSDQIAVIMLDGVTFGGFNVVDLERLWKETGIPVITVTRDAPDIDSMKAALQKHFLDWKERFALIQKNELFSIETEHQPLHYSVWGMDITEAKHVIRGNTIRGALPECIRVAHLTARGIVDGESRGKA